MDTLGLDGSDTVAQLVALYQDQSMRVRRYVVALADPADGPLGDLGLATVPSAGSDRAPNVLGYLRVTLPRTENTHLAELFVAVASRFRRKGIGTALWRLGEDVASARGRRTLDANSDHRHDPHAAPDGGLIPMTGVGNVPRDAASGFLLKRKMVLQQAEMHSTLSLPLAPARLSSLLARLPSAPDYRLVQWTGPTPQRWRATMIRLRARMSVDIPLGELTFEPEVWSEERLDVYDAAAAAGGTTYLSAFEHVPTGELIAYTQVGVQDARPSLACQEDTLVTREHRGHGLGLAAKLANLQLVARESPAVAAIHTWNAAENAHMLGINSALGFECKAWCAAWDKNLS